MNKNRWSWRDKPPKYLPTKLEQRAEAQRAAAGGPSPPTRPPTAAERAAAGGAPQLAKAPSALKLEQPVKAEQFAAGGPSPPARPPTIAERAAAGGATQPAMLSSETDEEFCPDWSADVEAASELHERLQEVEEADDIKPELQLELGRILFQKKP